MSERKLLKMRTLYLVQVLDPKPYKNGTKTLLPFQAKDLSLEHGGPLVDKPLRFVAFQEPLRTYVQALKPNDQFKVDYEEQARDDQPDYPPDRTIVQIYKPDGTPVLANQGFGGGGNKGNFGRSPESIRLEYSLKAQIEAAERVSIEGQTALNQFGAFILSKPTEQDKRNVGLDAEHFGKLCGEYWKAVEKSLDAFLSAKPLVIAAPPAGSPSSKPQGGQGTAPTAAKVSTDAPKADAPIFKNFGDLLTKASKLTPSVGRLELMKALNIQENGPAPTDLAVAWAKAEELSKAKAK